MKSVFFTLASAALACSAQATLSDVTITSFCQKADKVIVDYTLSAPAIVTVDFLVDGESIGEKNFANVTGDVNKYVETTTGKIVWNVFEGWPGDGTVPGVKAKVTAWQKETPPDYFVFDLATKECRYYVSTNALPNGGLANDCYKTDFIVMRKIPAANVEWTMGSSLREVGRAANEIPHRVRLTSDYYMAIYETTQAQYTYYGDNFVKTFTYTGEDAALHPASNLAFWHVRGPNDAAPGYYIGAMRKRGANFDLPTEAQWEYACRAGHDTALGNGKETTAATDDANVKEIGWAYENREGLATHTVGGKMPNDWGLYDMHGNVYEWCRDWYADYETGSVVDPTGGAASDGNKGKNLRGGSCSRDNTSKCRSAARGSDSNGGALTDRGFRMICEIPVN